jgi:large subunit ribosomal protein L25
MATTLHTETRAERGKNQARRLRRDGRIPGVVYGETGGSPAAGSIALRVDPHAVTKILRSAAGINTLIGLSVDDGASEQVMVKDYLVHPLSQELMHVDFCRVSMDKIVTVAVQVKLIGESEGVKLESGVLEFVHRQIRIECRPGDIPEHIAIDVSHLKVGQGVRLRDLLEGASWKPATEANTLIVQVLAPKGKAVEDSAEVETEIETAGADVKKKVGGKKTAD